MTPRRSTPFTRRRVLTGLGVGLVAVGASETGAFGSAEAPRTSTIQVVGDSNAILALGAFKESETYDEPHQVTVTNDTGVKLSNNEVSSANGKLEFQQGSEGPSSTLKLNELSKDEPENSQTFEIVTASDETGDVSDNVTLSYAQQDEISIELTREITVSSKTDPIGGLVYAVNGDIRVYDADQKEERRPPNSPDPDVIGASTTDFTADPNADIAFATSNGMYLTEVDGSEKKIGSPDHGIQREKTRLALAKWPGFESRNTDVEHDEWAIVYANSDKDKLFAMNANGNTEEIDANTDEEVKSPSNGAAGVAGVADIDDDSEKEMVFLGSSDQLRYLNQDGTTSKIENGGVGSSSSTGFGPPASFENVDNLSNVQMPFIDGSKQPSLVDYEGTTTTLVNSDDAKKATCAPFDVDNDGELEFVFIGDRTPYKGNIAYVDDVGGSNEQVKELVIETGVDGGKNVTRSPDVSTGLNSGTQTN